jgi:hypothetical protein
MNINARRDDRIRIINGGVMLDKWLEPGTEGVFKNSFVSEVTGRTLYLILIDGYLYTLAPAEFEVIEKV